MDKEQKERLEQELRFLEESLEADVISKDEYERGKERIEKKLKDIEEIAAETEETPYKDEKKELEREIKEEVNQEEKEVKEEIIEEEPEQEKIEEEKEEIEIREIREERLKRKIEETKEKEVVEHEAKEIIEEEPEQEKIEEEKEEIIISNKWVYGLAILIILALLFFSVRSCSIPGEEDVNETNKEVNKAAEEFVPECFLDSDCKKEGMLGTCLNPDTKEAKCEFKEDAKVELRVINDNSCNLCDTSRIKQIIEELFPNINIKDIDYKSTEAKNLITQLNITALPAYIFESNITQAINFDGFKRALTKKGNKYVIANTASGANYYFKREKIDNKLDVFLTPDIEIMIDNNLNEFLDLFKNQVQFTKHIITEEGKEELSEELGITSYPTFLINNQIKFGGIQSANSIKEKFCSLNNISGCEKELPKNIK